VAATAVAATAIATRTCRLMKTDGDGSREGSAASASSRHRPHAARGVYCITRHAASRSDFEPSGKRGVSRFTPPRDCDSDRSGAISRRV